MNPIRSVFILTTLSALGPLLLGEITETHLSLTVSHSELAHSVEFSTGGSDTAHPNIQAIYLSANIEWDTETLRPISVIFYNSTAFVGGGIRWDDYQLSVNTRLKPSGSPAFDSSWKFSFKNLTASVAPDIKRVIVLNEQGDLDLNLTVYRGIATSEFSGLGNNISDSVDFSGSLEILPLTKPVRLRIEKLPPSLMTSGFAFHFDFEFYEKSTERSQELGTTITAIDQGRFTLTGTKQTDTKFAQWSGWAGTEFPIIEKGAVSARGVPIELAYALNLRPRYIRPHRQPISLKVENGYTTLSLLSDGLNENIYIEYSTSLEPDSWNAVPDYWLENGAESIKAGSTAPISARIPHGSEREIFLRVRPDTSNL